VHDRLLFPRQTVNHPDEPLYDGYFVATWRMGNT
jgi:hypothetical protein